MLIHYDPSCREPKREVDVAWFSKYALQVKVQERMF